MRIRRLLLVATMLSSMAVAAACTGDDDDDDGSSPSPTGSATPFDAVGCQIVWISRDPPTQSNIIDYYVVDAPIGTWVTGTAQFFQGDTTGLTNVTGAFQNDFNIATDTAVEAMVATSGEFQLTVAGTGAGESVSFTDLVAQEYFLIDSAQNLAESQGDSGTGQFNGTWTPPGSTTVVEGSGTIDILYRGSSLTMGQTLSYALCYDTGSSFTTMTREQRIREAGRRAGALLSR